VVAGDPCSAAHRSFLFHGVQELWKTFLYFVGHHVCWPASCLRYPHGGVCFTALFPSLFFPTCCFLVIVAFPVCPGSPSVALWISWPVLLSVCVWRLSSTPPCVSHHLLSYTIARCLSPALPCPWPCTSGLVTCYPLPGFIKFTRALR
jgi:hypothetical protein